MSWRIVTHPLTVVLSVGLTLTLSGACSAAKPNASPGNSTAVYASAPDATPPAGTGTRIPRTLYGASVQTTLGSSYVQSRQAADRRFGRMEVVRYFDPDLPQPWSQLTHNVGIRPVVVSFRGDPLAVAQGKYDRRFKRWFRQAPRHRPVLWSYQPEPDGEIDAGHFAAADYRAAFRRLVQLSWQADNPNLRATLVLMCYTLTPYSHRNWRDYSPGAKYIRTMAWDCYNQKAGIGRYESPRKMMAKSVRVTRRQHKSWAVAEIGSVLVGQDDGHRRARWLHRLGRFANRHDAQFVTYFDSTVGGDYRLRDEPSKQAWRDVIDHR